MGLVLPPPSRRPRGKAAGGLRLREAAGLALISIQCKEGGFASWQLPAWPGTPRAAPCPPRPAPGTPGKHQHRTLGSQCHRQICVGQTDTPVPLWLWVLVDSLRACHTQPRCPSSSRGLPCAKGPPPQPGDPPGFPQATSARDTLLAGPCRQSGAQFAAPATGMRFISIQPPRGEPQQPPPAPVFGLKVSYLCNERSP